MSQSGVLTGFAPLDDSINALVTFMGTSDAAAGGVSLAATVVGCLLVAVLVSMRSRSRY